MMQVNLPLLQTKILVNERAVQEYRDRDGNIFVEGRKGSSFSLEISNLTPRRILAHPTVDGLSVMTGKEASKNDSAHGYILNPHQSMIVPGWRLNDSEVAQFFFTGQGKSYAEKIGKGEDKGVIAVAVWEEQIVPTWSFTVQKNTADASGGFSTFDTMSSGEVPTKGGVQSSSNINYGEPSPNINLGETPSIYSCNVNPAGASERIDNRVIRNCHLNNTPQNLGTGFGNKVAHAVSSAHFVPTTVEPVSIAIIYYNDLAGLRARGIKISEKKRDTGLPNPFPKDRVAGCTPPAGWNK